MPRFERLGIVEGALALFAVAVVGKAAHVQLVQRERWVTAAQQQHLVESPLPAPRGAILDAAGVTLAESREVVRLAIAPRELRDRASVSRRLAIAGVPAEWAQKAVDVKRAWVEIPGEFLPGDVAALTTMRGVHPTPVMQRVYMPSQGVRRIVGRALPDGSPVDGVELALDSVLRGSRGTTADLRDARGRRFASPGSTGEPARAGNRITLTLNHALQDICERALEDATREMNAQGGDIVVLDPKKGEVLALASRRADPRSTASTALTEPYEPGSTLKPFIAAALLKSGRATAHDEVSWLDGTLTVEGRTVTDVHKPTKPRITLAEVIKYSSNVGIVQFANRLTPREQYEGLRDFGFGSPSGLPYPSEASGTLRAPKQWSRQSRASIAMGYEIAVTPLQLASAYAAIANGGELLEPSLVKEVRAPDGRVLYSHSRRVVRRVLPPAIANELRQMLVGVVEGGTAAGADLATFEVGGKSGTARRTSGHGYAAGQYTASFVGLFPADDPQYVILVKLDNPVGAYYGGKVAAPVSKVVLQAAIAARDAALDRGALASHVASRGQHTPVADAPASIAVVKQPAPETTVAQTPPSSSVDDGDVPYVYNLAERSPGEGTVPRAPRAVPDVRGMPLRGAVRALHQAGFKVQLAAGERVETLPVAGAMGTPGTVIRLYHPAR